MTAARIAVADTNQEVGLHPHPHIERAHRAESTTQAITTTTPHMSALDALWLHPHRRTVGDIEALLLQGLMAHTHAHLLQDSRMKKAGDLDTRVLHLLHLEHALLLRLEIMVMSPHIAIHVPHHPHIATRVLLLK